MGSYASLTIGDLELYWTKNDVDPALMMLYTNQDKRVIPRSLIAESNSEDGDSDETPEYEVKYVTTLAIAKDRLEFMGFTLDIVNQAFGEGLIRARDELNERQSYSWVANSEEIQQIFNEEEQVLSTLTLDAWLEGFVYIVRNGLKPARHKYNDTLDQSLSPVVRYMLQRGYEELYGFPTDDFRVFMRAAVEITGTDADLAYDITDLVAGGYIDIDHDLCSYTRLQLAEEFVLNHKVVVLTEGITDCHALEGSLRLLYPHLADYYSFMDFEGARVPGSAGALASTIKAFIGACIVNRIIAFFDNDTAALAAMRALRDITIPDNVRVLRYPDIEIAHAYPTLGPQGTINMNVNGLAGSLEIYFGEDVLRRNDGSLTPVQWRGYDVTLNQYQGEILNKGELQERFLEKLRMCQSNPDLIENYDWSGIRAIIESLKTAFHVR